MTLITYYLNKYIYNSYYIETMNKQIYNTKLLNFHFYSFRFKITILLVPLRYQYLYEHSKRIILRCRIFQLDF